MKIIEAILIIFGIVAVVYIGYKYDECRCENAGGHLGWLCTDDKGNVIMDLELNRSK